MARGDVLLVSLPASDQREQSGQHPAIAVQTDAHSGPMLLVIPVTANLNALRFAHTLRVEPSSENGLSEASIVMVFQMRAIDKRRIIRRLGALSAEDMARVDAEIRSILGIES